MEQNPTDNKPTRIAILLPTNAYFMSGIRDFTMSFIKNATHFSQQWAYRFQSIVDELCNNAIEHGSAQGQDIKLTMTYYPQEALEITVEDTGTGKTKRSAEEIKKAIAEHKKPGYIHTGIRGRGLSGIVTNWTDELKIEDIPDAGLRIIAKKNLTPELIEQASKEQSKSLSMATQPQGKIVLNV